MRENAAVFRRVADPVEGDPIGVLPEEEGRDDEVNSLTDST